MVFLERNTVWNWTQSVYLAPAPFNRLVVVQSCDAFLVSDELRACYIWRKQDGSFVRTKLFGRGVESIGSLTLDGVDLLLIGFSDGELSLLSAQDARIYWTVKIGDAPICDLTISAEIGCVFVRCGVDVVKRFDLQSRSVVWSNETEFYTCSLFWNGFLVCGGWESLWLVDVKSGLKSRTIIGDMAVHALAGGRNEELYFASESVLFRWSEDQGLKRIESDQEVESVAIASNGTVVVGLADGRLGVVESERIKTIENMRPHFQAITELSIPSSGKIFTGSPDCRIGVWKNLNCIDVQAAGS
ncbi:MAG: hypothetical protein JWM11_4814, partial [Planctomycetaceae bacterium]|nr:hypothetical protein [Planctomycetaceae bacterium]